MKRSKGLVDIRRAHPRKVCAFCSKGANSEEHLWPDWARSSLHEPGEFMTPVVQRYIGNLAPPAPQPRRKQAGLRSFRLRVVCNECNNGWMSKKETELKPILSRLMNSNQATIDDVEFTLVRQWMFLKCVVMDYKSENNRAIHKEDAVAFRQLGTVPEYFRIGIALCGEFPWNLCFNQYTTHMPGVRALVRRDGIANLRLLSIGFEQLYLVAAISKSPLLSFEEDSFPGLKMFGASPGWGVDGYELPRIDTRTASSHVVDFKNYVEFPPYASAMKTRALQQGYVTREELDADLAEDRIFGYS